ncbi:MAG: YibE/F family protein, partial [Desulfobacteraceae bacterium]
MTKLSRDLLFSIVIAAVCFGLAFLDLARLPQAPTGLHARARITAVDNSHVRTNLIVKTEAQFL